MFSLKGILRFLFQCLPSYFFKTILCLFRCFSFFSGWSVLCVIIAVGGLVTTCWTIIPSFSICEWKLLQSIGICQGIAMPLASPAGPYAELFESGNQAISVFVKNTASSRENSFVYVRQARNVVDNILKEVDYLDSDETEIKEIIGSLRKETRDVGEALRDFSIRLEHSVGELRLFTCYLYVLQSLTSDNRILLANEQVIRDSQLTFCVKLHVMICDLARFPFLCPSARTLQLAWHYTTALPSVKRRVDELLSDTKYVTGAIQAFQRKLELSSSQLVDITKLTKKTEARSPMYLSLHNTLAVIGLRTLVPSLKSRIAVLQLSSEHVRRIGFYMEEVSTALREIQRDGEWMELVVQEALVSPYVSGDGGILRYTADKIRAAIAFLYRDRLAFGRDIELK